MPLNRTRYLQTRSIHNALAQYQNEVIIPHCQSCKRPCCKLTDVVLEFDWRHLVAFYQIEQGQKAFDRSLRDNTGPSYIRKQADRYYSHGSPCPAYDAATHRCRQYNSRLKPVGCNDFPVYLDDQRIVADKRCEAVDGADLIGRLKKIYPGRDFIKHTDPHFPVLVYIDLAD